MRPVLDALPLFTIGHSTHSLEHFVELLMRYGVEVVADVRSSPSSRLHPHFSQAPLKKSLSAYGIKYVFLGKELGARRTEREAYQGNIASYELIATLPLFRRGLDRVREGTGKYRVALMCAEKEPLDCHRTLLVCQHLRTEYFGRLFHILHTGELEPHEIVEQRLMASMGMNKVQDEMFSDQVEDALKRAYRKRGFQIAYQESSE